ncbi:MAG: hypothetical protein MRERV_7c085 [Mycoplasmataceae bacterium RV_VA103A]|nr:MAG: hypothetical protein MRERV_7c085 [Mycoplasmataceae bacterium RV_VA103A]
MNLKKWPPYPKLRYGHCYYSGSENCAHSVDAHPNADKITLIYRSEDLIKNGWKYSLFAPSAGIGHSGDGICERCLYLITSAHERNAENRRIAEEQERIKKEKQILYKQTCQKFKELEDQLKKQGTDICRYCLNKINGGDWRKWIENHNGAFSYNSKLISEKCCYNCEIEQDIKEQEKERKEKYQQRYQELKEEIKNDQMGGVLLDTSIDLALSFGEISEKQAKELHRLLERSVKDQEKKMREQEERELREENEGSNQEGNNQYDDWNEPKAKIEAGEEVDLNQWNLSPRQRRYLEEMIRNRSSNPNPVDSKLIQQLRTQISTLESNSNRTPGQEQELVEKKRKLEELERKLRELENKTDSTGNKDKGDKTGLYIGLGIGGTLVILFIIIFIKTRKKKSK